MSGLDGIPRRVLTPGMMVFHGTACAGDFTHPDGPAWFCFTRERGEYWTRWASTPPEDRQPGPPRVLSYVVKEAVTVLDTTEYQHWLDLCRELTGDEEAGIGWVAEALGDKAHGWYGKTEVMLRDPARWLAHLGTVPVRNQGTAAS